MPDFPEILRKKRDGEELTTDEINWFIQEVVKNTANDCQIGAMLMAIYLKGMTGRETVSMTKAMLDSGELLEWKTEWEDVLVDKHSTGGCGDKVSLVLAPALAACGFKVPMLSGRGLEHTGGTLDKLESIPGFKVQLTKEEMEVALEKAGCFIAGPTSTLVPADKELYKRRDVTATVDSIPLIAGSIISKKVSEGIKTLVMDVKVGSGAFIKTREKAQELASELIRVSAGLGVKTQAALTSMNYPIGRAVGNSLEVAEAIECMKGNGPDDLVELVTTLGGMIVQMKGHVNELDEGKERILHAINSGKAMEKFRVMLICQGVEEKIAAILCTGDMWTILPTVPTNQISTFKASTTGILTNLDALLIAKACWKLGAGRSSPGQSVDQRVGIKLLHKVGEHVRKDDGIMEIHHSTPELDKDIQEQLLQAVSVTNGIDMPSASRIMELVTN